VAILFIIFDLEVAFLFRGRWRSESSAPPASGDDVFLAVLTVALPMMEESARSNGLTPLPRSGFARRRTAATAFSIPSTGRPVGLPIRIF